MCRIPVLKRVMRCLAVLSGCLLLMSCTNALRWTPEYHTVRAGETLYSIAMRYNLDHRYLAQWNGLGDGTYIRQGQKLRLKPGKVQTGAAPPRAKAMPVKAWPAPRWSWPTAGQVAALKSPAVNVRNLGHTRLRAAGAIFVGRLNMHEFAYGITSEGSAFGAVRTPYDPSRTPGGSSGGTGAAVAANFAAAGMGSDTCGSIRIPAAHNNLVGLRGTQGLSSRRGIIPLSHTQDIGEREEELVDLAVAEAD